MKTELISNSISSRIPSNKSQFEDDCNSPVLWFVLQLWGPVMCMWIMLLSVAGTLLGTFQFLDTLLSAIMIRFLLHFHRQCCCCCCYWWRWWWLWYFMIFYADSNRTRWWLYSWLLLIETSQYTSICMADEAWYWWWWWTLFGTITLLILIHLNHRSLSFDDT